MRLCSSVACGKLLCMKHDSRLRKMSDEDARPATKYDIDELAQITSRQLGHMDDNMTGLRSDVAGLQTEVARLQRGQAAILNVVTSIDEKLKGWEDIPERVDRLEDKVFSPR